MRSAATSCDQLLVKVMVQGDLAVLAQVCAV